LPALYEKDAEKYGEEDELLKKEMSKEFGEQKENIMRRRV
jgi:hypothetical protein